jgi:hypothetical protein
MIRTTLIALVAATVIGTAGASAMPVNTGMVKAAAIASEVPQQARWGCCFGRHFAFHRPFLFRRHFAFHRSFFFRRHFAFHRPFFFRRHVVLYRHFFFRRHFVFRRHFFWHHVLLQHRNDFLASPLGVEALVASSRQPQV